MGNSDTKSKGGMVSRNCPQCSASVEHVNISQCRRAENRGTLCKSCATSNRVIRGEQLRGSRREKSCSHCAETKPFTEFYRSKGTKDGYHANCKKCAAILAKNRRYWTSDKAKDKAHQRYQSKVAESPEHYMLIAAKKRAKKQGVPFDLQISDIVIPNMCPILGVPLVKQVAHCGDTSPTLDKIVPDKGYIKSNIAVISHRANQLKGDATIEEFEMVLAYLDRYSL